VEEVNNINNLNGTSSDLISKTLNRLKIGKYTGDKITINKEKKEVLLIL